VELEINIERWRRADQRRWRAEGYEETAAVVVLTIQIS